MASMYILYTDFIKNKLYIFVVACFDLHVFMKREAVGIFMAINTDPSNIVFMVVGICNYPS